jgi:hypothetical protein
VTSSGNTLQSDLTVTLNAAPAAGTELADATFGALGSFTFTAGSGNGTTNSSLLFTPTPDNLVEGDELALIVPVASMLSSEVTYTPNPVTILDGNSATVSFKFASTIVGENDPASKIVLVLVTAPGDMLENSATVTVNATNGTASNADYDAGLFPKSVIFAAGQESGATQIVNFAPTSDTFVEGDETITLTLSSGFLLTGSGQTSHLVTVQDGAVVTNEDTPVSVTFAAELGDQPNYIIVAGPLHGTVSGTLPNLIYWPSANFNGSDSFLVHVYDGQLSSFEASIGLVINPVNDEPQFAIGTQISATDESPEQMIANWAANISPGPTAAADEAAQSISFTVSNDSSGLFKVQPSISASGTLTFTPAPNVQGTAFVNVVIEDDGGTSRGGIDHSLPQTFLIEVKKARIWHNAANELDVNGDAKIAPNDVVDVINFINAFGGQRAPSSGSAAGPYWDVSGDGWVAPGDALDVINYIDAFGADGEGQSPLAQTTQLSGIGDRLPLRGELPAEDLFTLLALEVELQPKRRS